MKVRLASLTLTYEELSELIKCIGTAPGYNDERAELECMLMVVRDEIEDD